MGKVTLVSKDIILAVVFFVALIPTLIFLGEFYRKAPLFFYLLWFVSVVLMLIVYKAKLASRFSKPYVARTAQGVWMYSLGLSFVTLFLALPPPPTVCPKRFMSGGLFCFW